MAITTVGFASAINTAVSKPGGAASGDVGVVLMTSFGAGAQTGASGWTAVTGSALAPTANLRHSGWYRVLNGSEGASFSFTAGSGLAVSLGLYRGGDGTTPLNAFVSNSTSGALSLASGNITTTVNGCQLVALCSSDGFTITVPATFTEQTDPDGGDSKLADKAEATAATTSVTMNLNGTTDAAITYLAVAPAGGGGGQDTPELYGRPFGRRGQGHMHQLLAQ